MALLYVFIYTKNVGWSTDLVSEIQTNKEVISVSGDDERVRELLKQKGIKKLPVLFICRHIKEKSYSNIEYEPDKIREYIS